MAHYLPSHHTVAGRNPAPRGMYKTLGIMGYLPYQLVQDLCHQQQHLAASSDLCFNL